MLHTKHKFEAATRRALPADFMLKLQQAAPMLFGNPLHATQQAVEELLVAVTKKRPAMAYKPNRKVSAWATALEKHAGEG